jgi:peptidoglycan/xylan/chitin deacetylase (PgdA/CDA1 family)
MLRKRLKYLIAFILYYTGLIDFVNYIYRKIIRRKTFTILTYHCISEKHYGDPFLCVSPRNFEKQIEYLQKRYKIVSLTNLIRYRNSAELPFKDYIAITFDDGYRDNYTNAYPILKKYRVPATIFLSTDYIGTDKLFWWDRLTAITESIRRKKVDFSLPKSIYPKKIKTEIVKIFSKKRFNSTHAIAELSFLFKKISERKRNLILSDLERQISYLPKDEQKRPYPLTWEQVRQMSENDIEFGSHTITHSILTRIKQKQAEYEIRHSKLEIERKIGRRVLHFCYPNGERSDCNEQIKQCVKDNNYITACSAVNGTNKLEDDVFFLKRRTIENFPIYIFAAKIMGF